MEIHTIWVQRLKHKQSTVQFFSDYRLTLAFYLKLILSLQEMLAINVTMNMFKLWFNHTLTASILKLVGRPLRQLNDKIGLGLI